MYYRIKEAELPKRGMHFLVSMKKDGIHVRRQESMYHEVYVPARNFEHVKLTGELDLEKYFQYKPKLGDILVICLCGDDEANDGLLSEFVFDDEELIAEWAFAGISAEEYTYAIVHGIENGVVQFSELRELDADPQNYYGNVFFDDEGSDGVFSGFEEDDLEEFFHVNDKTEVVISKKRLL